MCGVLDWRKLPSLSAAAKDYAKSIQRESNYRWSYKSKSGRLRIIDTGGRDFTFLASDINSARPAVRASVDYSSTNGQHHAFLSGELLTVTVWRQSSSRITYFPPHSLQILLLVVATAAAAYAFPTALHHGGHDVDYYVSILS